MFEVRNSRHVSKTMAQQKKKNFNLIQLDSDRFTITSQNASSKQARYTETTKKRDTKHISNKITKHILIWIEMEFLLLLSFNLKYLWVKVFLSRFTFVSYVRDLNALNQQQYRNLLESVTYPTLGEHSRLTQIFSHDLNSIQITFQMRKKEKSKVLRLFLCPACEI